MDELLVQEEDHVILKPRIDPSIGTGLDLRRRSLGNGPLLLGGYATNIRVEAIARTAHGLNDNGVLMSDCCFNVDQETIMPTIARVMTSTEALALLR